MMAPSHICGCKPQEIQKRLPDPDTSEELAWGVIMVRSTESTAFWAPRPSPSFPTSLTPSVPKDPGLMNPSLQHFNEHESPPPSAVRTSRPSEVQWDVIRMPESTPKVEPLSDDAIASACAQGDSSAIAELFDRYERALARFVCRQVPSEADVEDIVQATFVNVVRGISRFDGRSLVSTWLLGIAANVIKHHLRSKARRQRFERCLSLVVGEGREARVAERIEAKRSLMMAHRALQKLDSDKQRAFVLCEIEGLSAREVAQTLGATETTVWKRVSDTRKILKRAMPNASI